MKKTTLSTAGPDFTTADFEAELAHEKYKRSFAYSVRSTIYVLIVVAAIAILVAVLLLPVLQIFGNSMTPTLAEGNFIVSVKGSELKTGDIVAFYYNNKILVKRVIANSGDWVDIDKDGTLYINNQKVEEPYVSEPSVGICDIKLPYQVPESRIFVMGDHRNVSVDSRTKAIGCVAEEQIVGKIVFCVWPLSNFGAVK